jgi:hypothetical protein
MNSALKTYGVVINLDYIHNSYSQCQYLWQQIVAAMLKNGFHFDKRMFVMTTHQDINHVSELARETLNTINQTFPLKENLFHYLMDFLTVDMSHYIDLRLPKTDSTISIDEEHYSELAITDLNNMHKQINLNL